MKKKYIERTLNWFCCDNIVNEAHEKQLGLLHMGFPRVFILIRDYADSYFANFDDFRDKIAEITFFDAEDKETTDKEALLIDAWNFLALQEEEEDRQFEERNGEY